MPTNRHRSTPPLAAGLAAVLCALAPAAPAAAADLGPETVKAWNAYVAATEARIEGELRSGRGFLAQDFAPGAKQARARVLAGDVTVAEMRTTGGAGDSLGAPDGLVHHWRGSVFLPGATLDALLTRLQHPSESGPHQEDVLALRVLARQGDALTLFIRMARKKVVTVTYDTEHDVRYRRHGPGRASSRSVATKIAELDQAGTREERERPPGHDRGFMWRLNSYWRYEQVDGGVIVELESLTLSRDVPLGLRVLVQPLIDRVARESMGRTLDNLRRTHAQLALAPGRGVPDARPGKVPA